MTRIMVVSPLAAISFLLGWSVSAWWYLGLLGCCAILAHGLVALIRYRDVVGGGSKKLEEQGEQEPWESLPGFPGLW